MKKDMKLNVLIGLAVCFILSTSPLVKATDLSSSSENETITTTTSSTSELDSSASSTQTSETAESTESSEMNQATDSTQTTTESDSNASIIIKEATSLRSNSNVGPYQSYGKYITITSPYYSTYNNFSWNERNSTKQLNGKTFFAKGKYQHINGSTYLSLFDNNGDWYGYLNADATRAAESRQGVYQNYWKYVTIKSNNYSTYNDFSWNKRHPTRQLNGETYLAKGKYQHINGLTYLSLYDGENKWFGYVNASAAQVAGGRQGIYQNYGQYVTIKKKNYTTYNNFSWSKKNSTSNLTGKTYLAKGKYQHINGATYLSLFDGKGKWYGYVNAKAIQKTGAEGGYIPDGRYIEIIKKNYDIWQNFSWQKRSNTSKYYGQKLKSKGRYTHFNGATYLSLYNLKGKWVGYLNISATVVWRNDSSKVYPVDLLGNSGILAEKLGEASSKADYMWKNDPEWSKYWEEDGKIYSYAWKTIVINMSDGSFKYSVEFYVIEV